MNIEDKARELAAAIQECREYQDLVEAGKLLAQDEKTLRLVKEFLVTQAQLAYAQSMGGKPIRKKTEQLQRLSEQIQKNQHAAAYLQTYNRWQVMAGAVYQVIQNSMAEGMSILDQ